METRASSINRALDQVGDKWCDDGSGPPMLLDHTLCSHRLEGEVRCDHCRQPALAYRVRLEPSPPEVRQ